MHILFGIQATGYGHTTRAGAIIPHLQRYGDVDIVVSGYTDKLQISHKNIRRKHGISFMYDQYGRVSITGSLKQLRLDRFISDVRTIDVEKYDLIISDFEPVTAWAARRSNRECVGLSHQASFLSPQTPRPESRSLLAEGILHYYAPINSPRGFHFQRYDTWIEPPVIRNDVLDLNPEDGGHVTVYLPAYSKELLTDLLKKIPEVEWEIFSPHCVEPAVYGNVTIQPLSYEEFLRSLESCHAVFCGAGFETCAESLYLGKKLLVTPVKNQYEQQCNAAALERMGVLSLYEISDQSIPFLKKWIKSDSDAVILPERCDVAGLVDRIILERGEKGGIAN